MENKKIIVSFSIDQETLDRLTILCGKEERNASNMIRRLINICFLNMPEEEMELEKGFI